VLGATVVGSAHEVTPRPGIRSVVPSRAAAGAAASYDIPLAGDGQQVIVEGTFNETVSGPMLVDTGASYCVLTRATARRLGLRPHASTAIPVATANGEVAAGLVTLSSVKIENARLAYVEAVIMDAVEPPLVGIIGLTFLRKFRYSVDHSAGIFRLER
jgi:clan AA aspartic protease (TIGR02281 family)